MRITNTQNSASPKWHARTRKTAWHPREHFIDARDVSSSANDNQSKKRGLKDHMKGFGRSIGTAFQFLTYISFGLIQ